MNLVKTILVLWPPFEADRVYVPFSRSDKVIRRPQTSHAVIRRSASVAEGFIRRPQTTDGVIRRI